MTEQTLERLWLFAAVAVIAAMIVVQIQVYKQYEFRGKKPAMEQKQ